MASRSDIKAGSAFVELTLKNDSFLKAVRASGQQLQNFGKSLAAIGATMSAAGGAILAPMIAGLAKFISKGEGLYEMSRRTGITAKGLAELGYAAKQSGTDMEQVEGGVRRMQKFLGDAATGSAEARTELARLGLSLADLQGQSPDEQFEKIGEKIAQIQDPTMRAAEAMAIFGKSGTELLPLFENLDKVREARELGIGPSEAEVNLAHQLSQNLGRLSGAWDSVTTSLGAAIAPMVNGAIPAIVGIVKNVKDWVRGHAELIQRIAGFGAVLLGAGAAVTALGGAIAALGFGLTRIGKLFSPIKSLFGVLLSVGSAMLTPFGLIAIAVGGAVAAFVMFTDAGQAMFQNVMGFLGDIANTFKTTFAGIGDALSAGDLALAGSIAIAGLKVAMLQGASALSSAVGGEFGDMIGDIGSRIAGGDLSGAWGTVVTGMGSLWAKFSQGIVTVFTGAARAVVQVWKAATGWIADKIQGIYSDLSGLTAENEKIDANSRRLIEDTKKNLAARRAAGEDVADPIEGSAQQIKASDLIDQQAAGFNASLDELQKTADDNAKKAADKLANRVSGGGNRANQAFEDSKKQLEDLRNQAAKEKADKDAADAAKLKTAGGGAAGLTGPAGAISGTFSAAAAAQLGGGQSVPSKIDDTNKKLDKQTVFLQQAKDELTAMRAALGTGTT